MVSLVPFGIVYNNEREKRSRLNMGRQQTCLKREDCQPVHFRDIDLGFNAVCTQQRTQGRSHLQQRRGCTSMAALQTAPPPKTRVLPVFGALEPISAAWSVYLNKACPCAAATLLQQCNGWASFRAPWTDGPLIHPEQHGTVRRWVLEKTASLSHLRALQRNPTALAEAIASLKAESLPKCRYGPSTKPMTFIAPAQSLCINCQGLLSVLSHRKAWPKIPLLAAVFGEEEGVVANEAPCVEGGADSTQAMLPTAGTPR